MLVNITALTNLKSPVQNCLSVKSELLNVPHLKMGNFFSLTSPSAYFGETCREESTLEHPPYHVHILQPADLGFLIFSFLKAAIIRITSQYAQQMLTVR